MASQNVVCVGDSITAGLGVTTPWPSSLSLTLSSTVTNKGISGNQMAYVAPYGGGNVDPLLVAGQKNVLIIWLGTNDFAVGGATPATVEGELATYVAARQAAGWYVISVNMIDRGDFNVNTQKAAYNTYMGTATLDGVVVLPTLTPDGSSSNTTNFQSDKVHPTQLAHTSIMAPAVSAVINGLPAGIKSVLSPLPIAMAQAPVTFANGNTAPQSIAYTNPNTAGNLLVAVLEGTVIVTLTGITDTQGNTWHRIPGACGTITSFYGEIWYAANCRAGANTLSVAMSGSAYMNGTLYEFAGIQTGTPLDQSAFQGGQSGTHITSGNVTTTTQANQLLIAFASTNTSLTSITPGSGYTLDDNLSNVLGIEHKIVSALGVYQGDVTYGASATLAMAGLATFMGFPSASGGGAVALLLNEDTIFEDTKRRLRRR